MKLSLVIRTLNEAKHLMQLLQGIRAQHVPDHDVEVIVVDSGSTDGTLEIAESMQARVVTIEKSEFTFGRSLNIGCAAASGDILIFISGHCIPVNNNWLAFLVDPIINGKVSYSYGKQIVDEKSKLSEGQLLKKYFPDNSAVPQHGFFVNNANSALHKSIWKKFPFDETLTGLEDMDLGKRLVNSGLQIGYVAEASVFHLHDETWPQVRRRYERESIALQKIMPEVQLSFGDFLRFFFSAVLLDCGIALQEGKLHKSVGEIVMFRLMQFWGSFRGNHANRVLSREMKYRYFYPK
ncbi:glycosyltransferase family 2 protein [Polaromonas sp.]|uniref:glycosyltransferase family 2 protein n=1 Tax=Polaromonas sp. TaxID=1869339 RepID=UPI003BB7BAED